MKCSVPRMCCCALRGIKRVGTSDRDHRRGRKSVESGHPLTGLCQEAIAFFSQPLKCRVQSKAQIAATRLPADSNRTRFLAPLAANRIAPVTHQVQACRDGLRPPWRHGPPQRNVGAKPCPRGWSHFCGCRVGDASPQRAHGLGDSVICTPSGGTKTASNHSGGFTRPLSWLTAFGHTVTQNSAAHRRASARAACGSTPAPVCARSP